MPIRIVPAQKGRRNTPRENRLEELGRVDAEKAYTSKGKRNLRDEKHRIRKELKKGGKAKPWGSGPKPGTIEYFQSTTQKPQRIKKSKGGHVKSRGKALRGGGAEIK